MQEQPPIPPHPKRQEAAFLVIAMILIIILSGLGIAAMSETTSSSRGSNSYAKYIEALDKAKSMAQYAKRILETYPDGKYPGPATCNSTSTCNVIDSTFPQNGRPVLAWTSGLGSATMNGTSESNSWWNDHGFAYEGAFANGNGRVVVQLLGANTTYPYQHTYRIVGYGTDATQSVRATYELFHVWKGYRPDPGDHTCTGSCNYGECCSAANVCASDQSSCEGGSAAYAPPGWLCYDYFVTGLGYSNPSTCNNQYAKVLDALVYMKPAQDEMEAYYKANSSTFPTSATQTNFDQYYSSNPVLAAMYFYGCDQSDATSFYAEFLTSVTGQPNAGIVLYAVPNGDSFTWNCRRGGSNPPNMQYLPPYCGDVNSAAGVCDCNTCGGIQIDP